CQDEGNGQCDPQSSILQSKALGDLLLEAVNETVGGRLRVTGGPKRILQLCIGEVVEALAYPAHVGRRDPFEEHPVPAVVVEAHVATFDSENELRFVEHLRIAA